MPAFVMTQPDVIPNLDTMSLLYLKKYLHLIIKNKSFTTKIKHSLPIHLASLGATWMSSETFHLP